MARVQQKFFNPSGVPITRAACEELKRKTPDPYLIHEFENDRVFVQMRHVDMILNADDIPANFRKMYSVRIYNIITMSPEGNMCAPYRVIDLDSRDFTDLDDANAFYNSFLAKFTESHFDEDNGKLVEVGNILAPADPDKPTIASDSPMAEEFGSW